MIEQPFVINTTVKFRDHFGDEYRRDGHYYARVEGIYWDEWEDKHGHEQGHWLLSLRVLRHDDDLECLNPTQTMIYMVPHWSVEMSPMQEFA